MVLRKEVLACLHRAILRENAARKNRFRVPMKTKLQKALHMILLLDSDTFAERAAIRGFGEGREVVHKSSL